MARTMDHGMYVEGACKACMALQSAVVMDNTRDKLLTVLGHQDVTSNSCKVSSCGHVRSNVTNVNNGVTNNVTNGVTNYVTSCDQWIWQVMNCLNQRRCSYFSKSSYSDLHHDLVSYTCNCNLLALAWGTLCPCRQGFLELMHAHIREEHDKPLGRRQPLGVQCALLETFLQQVVPVDSEDVETHNLFVDAFLHNNRLEHMIQVMGYHPQYLECFLKTQQYMLRGDGPLPYDYRHYIAIMAASRHQCSYLVNSQITEFLNQGGDERWLKGLEHIPKKLRDLNEINKILAHRPWLINKSHIEKLLRGQDNWSVGELMHAIVLLTHFHGLASFAYGCGINAEINHPNGHTYRTSSLNGDSCSPSSSPNSQPGTPSPSSDVEGGIEALMERMRKLTEEEPEEMSQEELLKRFEKVEAISSELPAASNKPSPHAEILRFISDPDFAYEDFAKRGTPGEIPTFRAQDYSWEDQGFSLSNRLYSEIGTLLDDKFRVAYNLTYYTMGDNTDVDTSSFRRSIWYYIHCMFGIRHDDYDYSEVNQLLERNLKAYIKTVTCYPERITRRDYESFMREFKPSEKVHVNIMMLEARIQAGLLYALRALMRYMT